MEDDFFGDATAHGIGELVEQLVSCHRVLVIEGQDHRVAERATPGQNRHLRDGIGVAHRRGRQGVTTLVIRRNEFLFIAHHPGAPLRTRHDSVDCFVQHRIGDGFLVLPGCQQGRLVQYVREVCTGEARSLTCQHRQVDALGHRLTFGMDFKDFLAPLHIRRIDLNLAVKATWTKQGRIQNVGSVGCGNQNHIGFGIKTIHLNEQLVESLLALVVATTHTGTAVAPDGINFIDEDDGWCVLFGLGEQISHARCSDPHKHFDKVRAGNRIKRHIGFPGNGSGKQGLTCSRRAIQKHTLRDSGSDFQELFRVAQKLFDLVELFDGLIGSGNVLKGHRGSFFGDQLRPRLTKLHHPRAATLHGAEQEPEN